MFLSELKLNEVLDAKGVEPLVVHLVRTLLSKGKDVHTWVTRGGDGHEVLVDDISWDPKWPSVVAIEYSIQKRDGDYINGQEYEFEADGLVLTKDKRGNHWLGFDTDENEFSKVDEHLETIGIEILQKLLDKGDNIWISRQGKSLMGKLQHLHQATSTIDDGPPEKSYIELEVDISPSQPGIAWRTNWWTVPEDEFADRVRVKKAGADLQAKGYKWHVTFTQRPRKLKEAIDTLGFEVMMKQFLSGKVKDLWIDKPTWAKLTKDDRERVSASGKTYPGPLNMTSPRHVHVTGVSFNSQGVVIHGDAPGTTSHSYTTSVLLEPDKQTDWTSSRYRDGYLLSREE